MTTPGTVTADPRVAPLVLLAGNLITRYTALVTTTAGLLPPEHHATLRTLVDDSVTEARAALDEIAAIELRAAADR